MMAYYFLQHMTLALGLAAAAICIPKWFYIPLLPRALLAASLVPQVIGVLMMATAVIGVSEEAFYMHSPILVGGVLLGIFMPRIVRHYQLSSLRMNVSTQLIMISILALVFSVSLGRALLNNAENLYIIAHDFNVYLSGAKAFLLELGSGSFPDSYGVAGDTIVVHPHSFVFEAYLSHAIMFEGEARSFPPLDLFPRLAQQLTMVYMLIAVAGASVVMGPRWAAVAAISMVVTIPFVYYISAELSRDAFRMVPLYGFIIVLSSLGLNFSSSLIRRGLLVGCFAAFMILSHTLGLIFGALSGISLLVYVVLLRRPKWTSILIFLIPVLILVTIPILRYLYNYIYTGEFMGYGLQYSIYRGTWLEPIFAEPLKNNGSTFYDYLFMLFDRYGQYFQLLTAFVSFVAAFIIHARQRVTYIAVLIAFWVPLLVSISGILDYSGIDLRDAIVNNFRYGLTFFLLSPPLLAAGVAQLGKEGLDRFEVYAIRRYFPVAVTAIAVCFACLSIQNGRWFRGESGVGETKDLRHLNNAVSCLMSDHSWFVDGDRWNTYFMDHPPVFAFSQPARTLLKATNVRDIETAFESINLKLFALIDAPIPWHNSKIYEYIKLNWVRIEVEYKFRKRELWVAPDMVGCVSKI